jgi:multidrug transporter EmrE-like cation transporter
MNPVTLGLIVLSVSFSAFAQISLKIGMSSAVIQQAMGSPVINLFLAIASTPAIFIGLVFYGLGMVTWLFVLAKIDVSQAYPFMGLGVVMTLTIGYFVLHEPINAFRAVGMLLVISGIVFVSQG